MKLENPLGYSFVGRRANNEDSYRAVVLAPDTYFVAVADGMGGAEGGEIASSLILMKIIKYLNEKFKKEIKNNELKSLLSYCFVIAQNVIRDKIAEEPELRGMGTTLTCAIIRNGVYVWGNIGDSRLYLINQAECKVMTQDHTYLYDSWKRGEMELTDENVAKHGHVISRVIDGGGHEPDIYPQVDDYTKLNDGEALIVCSDGAIINKGIISSDWLFEISSEASDLNHLIHSMVNFAYQNGSTDNITVVSYNNGFHFSKSKKSNQLFAAKKRNELNTNERISVSSFSKYIYYFFFLCLTFGLGYYVGVHSDSENSELNIGEQPNTSTEKSGSEDARIKPVKVQPADNNKYFELIADGEKLISNGKFEEARKVFKQAEKLNPSDNYTTKKIDEIDFKIASKEARKSAKPDTESNSKNTPAKIPAAPPSKTPGKTPATTPAKVSETTPGKVTGTTPVQSPGKATEIVPVKTPETSPAKATETPPNKGIETIPETTPIIK
jgi:serine/threonine protein phosphatase PrpC